MPATTISEVIQRLDAIVEEAAQRGDPLGIFALVYRGVTELVKTGIEQNLFKDGPRMERLDVIFANRYLDAYDCYRQNKGCTQSWLTAFKVAHRNDLLTLQHLLAGMNAHINLDLGIAAAEAVPPGELAALKDDFFIINRLLTEQIDAMQDKLSAVSPLLFLLDFFGKTRDEKFAEFSLKKARGHAWLVAQRLSKLPPERKALEIAELDQYVAVLSRLILEPGFVAGALVKLVRLFETKDVKRVMVALR